MNAPEGLAGLAAREAGHVEEPTQEHRVLTERVGELEAEVERLRADVVRRQELCDAYQSECEAANSALLESEADARGNAEACIVAWLRRRRLDTREYDGTDNAVSLTLAVTADRIERGEHRREEEP